MRNEIRKPRVINRNGKSTLILDDTPERKYHKISIELDKKEVEKIDELLKEYHSKIKLLDKE